jgi:hypothetical protein
MKIQTNLRAGAGGATGVGKNSKTASAAEVQVVEYYPPVIARCVGI